MRSKIASASGALALLLLGAAGAEATVPPEAAVPPETQVITAAPEGEDAGGQPVPQPEAVIAPKPQPQPEAVIEPEPGAGGSAIELEEGTPPPLSEGGASPLCNHPRLGSQGRSDCRRSRSVSRSHPLSSYGIDNNVEVGFGNAADMLPLGIQWLLVMIWQGLLYVVNGILLLLEWTFSLDLVGQAMASVRESLSHLNDQVLGQAWMLAGISIAGLWGIWNGLVRLRTTETMLGLGGTVLLMCLALLIIHQPGATVGKISAIANQGSIDAISLATGGSVDDGAAGYANASRSLFNTIALEPWCALQFGDVAYCYERPGKICKATEESEPVPGNVGEPPRSPGREFGQRCEDFDGTIADAWLRYPAGSEERQELWRSLAEEDPSRASVQAASGTMDRLGLLVLIAIGMGGASALLLFLAVRLVVAAVTTLALLIAAPVVLVMPAFGEAGRSGFLTYLKRTGGAAAAKFIYALFLAIVILLGGLIAGLEGIGWHAKWMILIAFWWGVFLRREELVGFVLPANPRGGGLSGIYHGYWLANSAAGAATALPRRAARLGTAGARAARHRLAGRREGREKALRRDAKQELWRRGSAELLQRRRQENREASQVLERAGADRRRRGTLRSELRTAERDLAGAQRRREDLRRKAAGAVDPPTRERLEKRLEGAGREVTELKAKRDRLSAERDSIDRRLNDPRVAWAQTTARRHGGRDEVSDYEVRNWVTRREAELSGGGQGGAETQRDHEQRTLFDRVRSPALSRTDRRAASEELRVRPERDRAVRDWSRQNRRASARQRRRSGMGRS